MLPLHNKDDEYKPGFRLKAKIFGWFRAIFSDVTSRNLFLFLLLNLSFAFVELSYGVWTNSLGLISDSFHMFFDCTALLAGLAASVVSRWRANERFSYGYVRAEILAGFINGLFLIFIAFFIFSEAIERLVEPPEVKHERLFVVSVLGFLVNLVGIFAFHHGHSHSGGGHDHSHSNGGVILGHGHSHGHSEKHGHSHGHSEQHRQSHDHHKPEKEHGHSHDHHSHDDHGHGDHHGHDHGHDDHHGHSHDHGHSHGAGVDHSDNSHGHSSKGPKTQILQGVFLHILADTLGSVGVIVSAVLMHYFGWMIADPICSMFISLLIFVSVMPLLQESVSILMMRTPYNLDSVLPSCYQRVTNLDGVYSVQEPHFWTLCSDVYVGMVKLEVAQGADTKYIQSQTHNIFTQAGIRQLYVQIDHAAM